MKTTKVYFFLRFGSIFNSEVASVIKKHMDEHKGVGIPSSSTMITIFKSKSNIDNIHNDFMNITPEIRFFLIDITENLLSWKLPDNINTAIEKLCELPRKSKLESFSLEKLQKALKRAEKEEEYELCEIIYQLILSKKSKGNKFNSFNFKR